MKNSAEGRFVASRTVRNAQAVLFLAISLLALTLLLAQGALSQESHPQSTSSTELGRENLARVAASVQEIKLLLLKDSGLLLEVRRWMAKEATSNGQVINDMDLTEDAIFDRLVTDLPFRSAITLILQKYGHLIPKLNPESEAAKERELVLQERARIFVQARQTDLTSLQRSAAPGRWDVNPCDPQTGEKCTRPGETGTEQPGLREYVSQPGTTPEVPIRPASPYRAPGLVETAQTNYADDKTENLLPMGVMEDANQAIARTGAASPEALQGPSTALLPGVNTSEGTGVEFLASNYVPSNESRTLPGVQNQDLDN